MKMKSKFDIKHGAKVKFKIERKIIVDIDITRNGHEGYNLKRNQCEVTMKSQTESKI